MPRNIVVFSDGTGQRGGMFVDERRSNVYKLYRATRVGPENRIDPAEQAAFYDPGLGTLPGGIDSPAALARSIYNLASRATGLGITRNIVDCYAALVRMWRPGDRIYLFGFSRGAYTVRCLAGVLRLCGLPTTGKDGAALRRDAGSARRIAREAVSIYNYTNSRRPDQRNARQSDLIAFRDLMARRFQTAHRSGGADGGNATPFFIGVFDTVASLANPRAVVGLTTLAALATAAASAAFAPLLGGAFLKWFVTLALLLVLGSVIANLATRLRWAPGLPGVRWWRTVHLTTARIQMYDTELDEKVAYARHALSIDEARASFARVPWGAPGQWRSGDPAWFEQLWFAGDHSDIGGSYAEDESRLSDVSLDWMLGAAAAVGLKHDPDALRLHPDPLGMQHDETRSSIFRYARKRPRTLRPDAPLHPSVLLRLAAAEVEQYDLSAPYRPENLRHHAEASRFFVEEGTTDAR